MNQPASTSPRNTAAAERLRGVTYEPPKGTWRSRLYFKGRHVTLGRYKSGELAARAHDVAALFVFGPGASVNFRYIAFCETSKGLPFGINVRKHLMAMRQELARPASRCNEHDSRDLRARAAAAAFASVWADRSCPGVRNAWVECTFKATIAVAARLAA
jgi:hypothetical protein